MMIWVFVFVSAHYPTTHGAVSPDHVELLNVSAFHLNTMSADAIETDARQRVVAVFVVPLLELLDMRIYAPYDT